jgi:hypothetical protein
LLRVSPACGATPAGKLIRARLRTGLWSAKMPGFAGTPGVGNWIAIKHQSMIGSD